MSKDHWGQSAHTTGSRERLASFWVHAQHFRMNGQLFSSGHRTADSEKLFAVLREVFPSSMSKGFGDI